jgi:hypothetical protein
MADATVTSAANAVKADVVAVESKVVTFVKAHVPTVVGATAGFVVGKFGIIGAILHKIL